MTGGGGLALHGAPRGRTRWVGRASILESWPGAPQWLRLLCLSAGMFGLQITWSCEMAQASPYLLSLGLSKSMMSIVFVAGPLSGLIVQPLVGVLSDGCKSSLGRRRPFMIAGCIVSSLAVLLLGWAAEVAAVVTTTGGTPHHRLTIALAILSVYVIDFSINIVQAMDRSLLVDVVSPALQPAANAWASRMFGFGAVFGYWFGGIDLVSLTGGHLGKDQLKVLTFFTAFFLCLTHAITAGCVKERVLISREDEGTHLQNGENGTKRAILDIWTTFRTLPRPIQQVLNVQFSSWIGWFPVLFFTTTWVAEIYTRSQGEDDFASAPAATRDLGTRAGTRALFYHSVIALATSIVIPSLVAPTPSSPNSPYVRSTSPSQTGWRRSLRDFIPTFPLPWLSLPLLWTISNGLFSVLLLSTWFAGDSVALASTLIAGMGFCWAITNWAPFALLGELILRLAHPTASPIALYDVDHQHWSSHAVDHDTDGHAPDVQPLMFSKDYPTPELTEAALLARYSTPPLHSTPSTEAGTPGTAYYDTMGGETPVESNFPFPIPLPPPPPPQPPTPSTARANKRLSFPAAPADYPPNNLSHPPSFYSPYGSDSNLTIHGGSEYEPFGSPASRHVTPEGTPTVLQIRHSDSFEGSDVERRAFGEEEEAGLGFGRVGSGSVPTITVGPEGDEWEDSGEEGEMEGEGGGDQAGVILGCHNIYLVLPQFLVTALSSVIFALFAPHHSVIATHAAAALTSTTNSTTADVLLRAVAEGPRNDWDALGMIFRIGGVAAAVSCWVCWKMTRERDREGARRLREH